MNRCAAVFLLISTQCAFAQTASTIDPELDVANSAGYWESGNTRGKYRVLVFSGGYEHVSSWVVAEWVADSSSELGTPSVIHSKQLVGAGFFSFNAPIMTQHDGYLRVDLRGRDTHNPERLVGCIFDLFPDGGVKQVRPCS
jgi:hypothetical protein